MNEVIAEARGLWKSGYPEKALAILENNEMNDSAEALFLKGEIHYSMQNWGASLNCLRQCLQVDPEYKAAQTYVDLILNILGFFHTDQFNP